MKKRSPKSKVESPKSATGRDRRQIGMLPEVHLQLAPATAHWIAETLDDQLDEIHYPLAHWIAETLDDQLDEIHDPLPETTEAQVREAIKSLRAHETRWAPRNTRRPCLTLRALFKGSKSGGKPS